MWMDRWGGKEIKKKVQLYTGKRHKVLLHCTAKRWPVINMAVPVEDNSFLGHKPLKDSYLPLSFVKLLGYRNNRKCLCHTTYVNKLLPWSTFVVLICSSSTMQLVLCFLPPRQHVHSCLLLTLQVLEGQRHDAACSSGSHQALDVGCGQGQNESLLPSQVSACIEGDEDGLVHAWSRSWHHTSDCVSQLLGHKERLRNTQRHREF